MTTSRTAARFALLALVALDRASALPMLERDECLPFYDQAESGLNLTLAAADWDGDARAELAVGLPYFDDLKNVQLQHGALHVFTYDLAPPPTWGGVTAVYGAPEAQRGSAVAVGDFDGDQLVEFAAGAPTGGGGSVVVLGAGGIVGMLLEQGGVDISGGAEPADLFGLALAVGDFDDDGFDDLAVGVPGESWSGSDGEHQGAVQVFYGGDDSLDGARDLLFGQHSFTGQTREDADLFGRALAAGDLDGDGYDDLVIGVPDEDEGALADSGIVHVVFGSPTGLDFTRQQNWSQSSADIQGQPEANDRFGASLAIGSLDGGVFDPDRLDLAIGVPCEADGSIGCAGAVHVLYSESDGPDAAGSQFFLRPGGSLHDSNFGLSLHAADVDGDEDDDLLVGSEILSIAPPGFAEDGEVYLYFGRVGQPMVFSGRRPWTAAENACAETGSRAHEMDTAITTGDFDGDGELDLALGIGEWYEEDPFSSRGAAVVLYGALFADGFDTGDPDRWSSTTP